MLDSNSESLQIAICATKPSAPIITETVFSVIFTPHPRSAAQTEKDTLMRSPVYKEFDAARAFRAPALVSITIPQEPEQYND
jgi:hypothetical protein